MCAVNGVTITYSCASDNTTYTTYTVHNKELKTKRNEKKYQTVTWRKISKNIQKVECGLYTFTINKVSKICKLSIMYRCNIIEERDMTGIIVAKNYVDDFIKEYVNVPQANAEYHLQKLIDVCEKLAENCKDNFWLKPLLDARNFLNIGNKQYWR